MNSHTIQLTNFTQYNKPSKFCRSLLNDSRQKQKPRRNKKEKLSYKRFQEGKTRYSLVDDKTVIDSFVVTLKPKKIIVLLYFVTI